MGRTLDPTDLRGLLARNLEHARWDDVAVALPHLRQLHARLPHLLLHERRGRTDLAGDDGGARARLGLLLLASTTRTSTAAASARPAALATASG